MNQEYNDYSYVDAWKYTEQMVNFARQRWGDIPLSPQTYTWADGTVSIVVEHNICDRHHPTCCVTIRLNFQETGFRGTDEPQIRETVEKGIGSDGRVVHEEYIDPSVLEE